MRILITNDDGINAPGLEVLHQIATQLAGPDGQVWTVAPAFEQSGVGHCISYTHPTMVAELAPRRFAAEGSPADCVLAAVDDVMVDARPTWCCRASTAATTPARTRCIPAPSAARWRRPCRVFPPSPCRNISGPATAKLDDPSRPRVCTGATVRRLLDHGDWTRMRITGCSTTSISRPSPPRRCKGIRVARQGKRHGMQLWRRAADRAIGAALHVDHGRIAAGARADGTDVAVNLEGYVSVTPMRADLTCHDSLAGLGRALNDLTLPGEAAE